MAAEGDNPRKVIWMGVCTNQFTNTEADSVPFIARAQAETRAPAVSATNQSSSGEAIPTPPLVGHDTIARRMAEFTSTSLIMSSATSARARRGKNARDATSSPWR